MPAGAYLSPSFTTNNRYTKNRKKTNLHTDPSRRAFHGKLRRESVKVHRFAAILVSQQRAVRVVHFHPLSAASLDQCVVPGRERKKERKKDRKRPSMKDRTRRVSKCEMDQYAHTTNMNQVNQKSIRLTAPPSTELSASCPRPPLPPLLHPPPPQPLLV